MNEYLETRVMTASREQLHLMVVDSTLRHCAVARRSLQQGDREGVWSALSEARAHLAELISGVAEEQSELLENVRALFAFAYRELMRADTEQNDARIESAISVLALHRETWAMLMEQLANQNSTDDATPKLGVSA